MLDDVMGFVPVTNFTQARMFYETTLGLKLVSEDSFALEFSTGNARLRLVLVKDLTPQPFTVLGWRVDNVPATVLRLEQRGVRFERYKWMTQDDRGIWTAPGGVKVAWFKDPDGNILSVSSK